MLVDSGKTPGPSGPRKRRLQDSRQVQDDGSGAGNRRPVRSLEERWFEAAPAHQNDRNCPSVEALAGLWKVERLTGVVPMRGLYKRVAGDRGGTGATWSPLPDFGFHLTESADSVLLVYDAPLSTMRDELRREANGCWLGRAWLAGWQYAWFRLTPWPAGAARRSE